MLLLVLSFMSLSFSGAEPSDENKAKVAFYSYAESVYDCLGDTDLSYKALEYGLKGYYYLSNGRKMRRKRYLTVVDFSLPSNRERMFIIDLESKEIVHKTLVAHGKMTGELYAETFSNENESHMSSLGFYVTGHVYNGRHKESLKLHGLESDFNDNAYDRGVVIHSAEYATADFRDSNGNVLGRSLGCPALPYKDYESVIKYMRDGTCLFIYYPDRNYLKKSKVINNSKAFDYFMEMYES